MTDLAPDLTRIESDSTDLLLEPEAPRSMTDLSPDLADLDIAADIASLDDLWNQEWNAPAERSLSPQRIVDVAPPSTAARVASRTLDLTVAIMALLILLPLMIVVAVVVRLTSPGGAMFTHARVGRNGETFGVLKFRSMAAGTSHAIGADAEASAQLQANDFKLAADDPRITPIGRFIRKTSLDELPQLFNVIKGDMSVVGIRPLVPDEVALRPVHDQQIYKSRRPGMTGLWQVEGRSNIVADERVMLDRTYVQSWSVVRDLVIILRTPLALVRTVGAF